MDKIVHPATTGHEYALLNYAGSHGIGSVFVTGAEYNTRNAHTKFKAFLRRGYKGKMLIHITNPSGKPVRWWRDKLSSCGFHVNEAETTAVREFGIGWDYIFVCEVGLQ